MSSEMRWKGPSTIESVECDKQFSIYWENLKNSGGGDRDHLAAMEGYRAGYFIRDALRTQQDRAPMELTDDEVSYEVWQDGFCVAGASGDGALDEAHHYATMYGQDGPVTVYRVITKRAVLAERSGG